MDILRNGAVTGYKSSQSIPIVYNHSHSQNPKPGSHQQSFQHTFSQASVPQKQRDGSNQSSKQTSERKQQTNFQINLNAVQTLMKDKPK